MNASTIQHLADLKKAGFDTSSLENQMKGSPILDKRGDALMGGGILRQAEFTKITQDKARLERELNEKVAELARIQTAGVSENSPAYQAALQVISDQQDLLIKAGFDENEVKALSEKAIEKAGKDIQQQQQQQQSQQQQQTNPQQQQQQQTNENREGEMDTSNLLDLDTFQKQTVDNIFGQATLSAKIQHRLNLANRLGIDIPAEKIDNLGLNLRNAVAEGKNIDQFLDEDLGITAKQKEVNDAARQKEIDDARAAGRADGLKEAGVPRRMVTRTQKHPIYDNITPRRENGQQQENKEKDDDGSKDVPRNKWGDPEIFRTRGDKHSRIQAAEDYHEKVLERTAVQDSIPSE